MKIKLLLVLFCLFTLIGFTSFKQNAGKDKTTGYYLTYNDYVKNKITTADDIKDLTYVGYKYSVVFIKDDEKVKVKCSDMWGFKYRGRLFRIEPEYIHPVMVKSQGKIVYYTNGFVEIYKIRKNEDTWRDKGYDDYLSNDLNSTIVGLPIMGSTDKEVKKRYADFKAANPQHNALYECIGEIKSLGKVKRCVLQYNGETKTDENK
jgi:hypothetical protein